MRPFALILLVLSFAAIPQAAHAQPVAVGEVYVRASAGTPGEPPPAVLVMTGVAGMALVRWRKKSTGAKG
jgi:hypothetical protein